MRCAPDLSARRFLHAVAIAALVSLPSGPRPASAQAGTSEYRISQRAAVMQTLAGTTIELEYSRPLARGRAPLFGGVVHWGEVWTPGANEATVLELSDTVRLEGHTVPAGRWSVWMIPSNVGPWELMLDARDSLFHTPRPELTGDGQIRFPVRTETVDHVEALTWSFPNVGQARATLQMAWGTTAVPLQIEVDADVPVVTVTAEEAARYIGDWVITTLVSPGPESAPLPPPATVHIRHSELGTLVLEYPPAFFGAPPDSAAAAPPPDGAEPASAQARERAEARSRVAEVEMTDWDLVLVPRGGTLFFLGFTDKSGLVLDVERVFHEFVIEDGRAVRLEIRGPDDTLFARGERRR